MHYVLYFYLSLCPQNRNDKTLLSTRSKERRDATSGNIDVSSTATRKQPSALLTSIQAH